MKESFKRFIVKGLEKATARFFAAHPEVKVVAITGSVGKTSTRLATTGLLSRKYRVFSPKENHNTEFSVPLAILDVPYPQNPRSPLAWLFVLGLARKRAKMPYGYDVIVLELGTDKPGDVSRFANYLKPDISIVTAVSAEHMAFFKTVDEVAKEELSIADFSKLLLVNRDDVAESYAALLKDGEIDIDTYGMGGVAEYHFLPEQTVADGGYEGKLVSPEFGEIPVHLYVVGEHSVKAVVAASAVAIKMGLTVTDLKKAVEALRPVNGRMQPLHGVNQSYIIDDTYNSSPLAAQAALQTLYSLPNPHKIAILGSMNELGDYSQSAHEELGLMCDPTMLDWVITVGEEAEKYLAPAAQSRGCQVKSFINPYDAGAFAHSILQPLSAVLAKGSQDGVYVEEAVKVLLHSSEDEAKLVRQSESWLRKKKKQFSKFK